MRMRKVVGEMRGRQAVRDLLRPCGRVLGRRRVRCTEQPDSAEPQVEGVLYLTPDGDGYILYATRPASGSAMVAAVS